MKPNQIKMVISKQETQHRTHSCHFPATSCGRLGEGQFVYRWRWWKLSPPPTPLSRRIQIPHSSRLHKGCLLLALTSGSREGRGRKGCRESSVSLRKRGSPLERISFERNPSLFFPSVFDPDQTQTPSSSCINPHLKSRDPPGAPGPRRGPLHDQENKPEALQGVTVRSPHTRTNLRCSPPREPPRPSPARTRATPPREMEPSGGFRRGRLRLHPGRARLRPPPPLPPPQGGLVSRRPRPARAPQRPAPSGGVPAAASQSPEARRLPEEVPQNSGRPTLRRPGRTPHQPEATASGRVGARFSPGDGRFTWPGSGRQEGGDARGNGVQGPGSGRGEGSRLNRGA